MPSVIRQQVGQKAKPTQNPQFGYPEGTMTPYMSAPFSASALSAAASVCTNRKMIIICGDCILQWWRH